MSTGYYELSRMYNKHIDEIINAKQAALSNGGAPDFATYRNECGLIHGLKQSKLELRELVAKLSKEEDEEEGNE